MVPWSHVPLLSYYHSGSERNRSETDGRGKAGDGLQSHCKSLGDRYDEEQNDCRNRRQPKSGEPGRWQNQNLVTGGTCGVNEQRQGVSSLLIAIGLRNMGESICGERRHIKPWSL